MVNITAFTTIASRETARVFRIWAQTLVPPVITAVLYFTIFGKLIGSRIGDMQGVSYIMYIVPGLIMMSIITNSYANVVSSFFGAKFQRHIEEMLVSPMSNNTILCGFMLGGIIRGSVVGLLVSMVAVGFVGFHVYNIFITLLISLLTAVLFSLAGFFNGVFAKTFDDISLIPTFVLTPLTYLGGVFYSIELLPEVWQKITYLNPIFYMINAFRYGMIGKSDVELWVALSIVISLIAVLYLLNLWFLVYSSRVRA